MSLHIMVLRKGVKAKDINGHPPKPQLIYRKFSFFGYFEAHFRW